ncbi:MAG: type II toxin-antitoxin system VapC family toxin [Planctomycetes bacterium]|nr:type II toxin-antitoxin system VapC family toxin [Planctomycetota bacterium]
MKKLHIYVDTSVIGGCEDEEFSDISLGLWSRFKSGAFTLVVSDLTIQELAGAPASVRRHLQDVPESHQVQIGLTEEVKELADAYLAHGVVGPGSLADALHVALATVAGVDILVSWNFKHIVNFGRISLFNAVNLERGYGRIEIRTPAEVLYEGQEEDV